MGRLLALVSADAGGVRRFSGDFAFDRGQRAKVEPARVFALVIAVEHGERDAIGPSPIAVPQRDDAGPRRRFEHQRGTIARNRARMAFEPRSEEHTSELPSLMRISYAVFCLNKKKKKESNISQPIELDE